MKDSSKTKQKLIEELSVLKQKIQELEYSELERQQAEEALRMSEEKYRLVVENAKEAIIIAQDLKLVFVNRAAVDMIGYSGEVLIAPLFTDFIHPDDRNMVVDYHIRRLKGESVPLAYSFRIISQDGTVKWVEFNTAVIQWKEKPATLSFLNDITERRQTEEKLRQSEEYFKEITENSSDDIIITDKNGDVKYCSRSMERFSGYKPEELIGKSGFTFIHPDDIERAVDDFGKAILAVDTAIPNEFRLVRKDGSTGYFCGLGENLLDNPAVAGFVMNIRDINERKMMEKALQKAHDELEQQVEERTAELKTALAEIQTMKDKLEAENIYFRNENKMNRRFEHILGQSDGLKYVLYRAEQVALANTTVLILGETGTGKELIAAAIHNMSPRKDRPLITVNCASLPANLIESELFGREKGAFTGAEIRRGGRVEIGQGYVLC